ncbi:MAG: hypothetical protein ACFE8N_12565, partial [Promethearchaeota archaeon]
KVEIYNINVIYRGLKNNIDKNLLSQFLVNSYLFLDKGKMEYLLSLEDPDVFISLITDYVTNIKEIKEYYKNIIINQKHIIHSIEELYLNYYFKKFKIQIDDIDLITIFKILEVIIKKEEEIRFSIIPIVVNILHRKYRTLKTFI